MKNYLSHYSLPELKLRLALWETVLKIMSMQHSEICKQLKISLNNVSICFVIDSILESHDYPEFHGLPNPLITCGGELEDFYPETKEHKPDRMYGYSHYWWNPNSDHGRLERVKVLKLIVKNFKFEIKKRPILNDYPNLQIKKRLEAFRGIRSWFEDESLLIRTRANADIFFSEYDTSSICFAINNASEMGHDVPDAGIGMPRGLEREYPELNLYRPRTPFFYNTCGKRHKTGYWWAPGKSSGIKNRINVLNQLICDYECDLERRKNVK